MSRKPHTPRGLPIPSGRISRLARMGGLAAGLAGTMALAGGKQLASGQRPKARELLMTPRNAQRLTSQLAQMRGAAMKVGQMLSMEAADLMPPEFADILAALRSDAHFMPPSQLKAVLKQSLGPDFVKRFKSFDVHPIASASIGQVHRAQSLDGRDIALKVQYPGVRKSIDSDMRNVAGLLRMSGLIPKGLDIAPMLEEARLQLHQEADYLREAECMTRFAGLLADDTNYRVPTLQSDFLGPEILGMSFEQGIPIERLTDAPQSVRNDVATALISLVLRELFEFGCMQTDPNFANYLYDESSKKIVLLDFGATRIFAPDMSGQYRRLLQAGLSGRRDDIRAALLEIGLYDMTIPDTHEKLLLDLFQMAMEPLRCGTIFDFGRTDLLGKLRDAGMDMADDRSYVPLPPVDSLFLQRKIGGMYLLATRLRAQVDMAQILARYA